MKDQAIKKIDSGLKAYKGDRYSQVMKNYVADILKEFCEQYEEFAQAVVQGGGFEDCMKAVCKGIGSSISDFDVSKRAEDLEKKLKMADSSIATFQVYFQSVQEDMNRMIGLIKKSDPEQAGKMTQAMKALLDSVGKLVG